MLISLANEYSTNVELIKNALLIIKNTNLNISKNINVNLSFNLQNNTIRSIDIENLIQTYNRNITSFVRNPFYQINDCSDNIFINSFEHIYDLIYHL